MKRIRTKLTVTMMAVFLVAAGTIPAAAASIDKPIVQEYTFETSDKDFEYTENKVIEIDGKKYEAKDIQYEILSESKRLEEHREYSNLASQNVPETITTEDGSELTLEEVRYTTRKVTNIQTYRDYVNPPEIPEKIEFTVEGKSITGFLADTKKVLSDSYNVPFSINGKFYGDEDSMYYVLNGKNIPAETAPEFDQYPAELLAYLKLDSNIYRVDSGQWSSGYYDESGQTVRTATYNGMQKSNTYIVTYQGTIYDAKAVYSNGVKGDEATYKVKAIVEYEKKGLSELQKVILTAGIAIAVAVTMIALLFILKRKWQKSN